MKAVILAGGKGTRLGNIAKDIPKPMVLVGSIPVLEHQIHLLKKYGITDIIMCTGHLSNVIEEHFGDGSKFGVSITYSKEPSPLGTAGGLKLAQALLKKDFLVLYGDIMVNMNLKRLIGFHLANHAATTLVIHPNSHPHDCDLVEVDNSSRITRIIPKPHPPNEFYQNLVSAALYVCSPEIFNVIPDNQSCDFGHDVFPKALEQGKKLFGYRTVEYLQDMGTPERYEQVCKDYASGKISRSNIDTSRSAIFLDRDGVINTDVPDISKPEQFEFISGVPDAIRKINNSEYMAVVVTNQPQVAKGFCTEEAISQIHKKMETLLGKEHAKVDAIFDCYHHPDKGFSGENPKYKIECDCRKPKIGMIEEAKKEFNIDLTRSYIIGDRTSDIQTGKNAGLKTILVRTGCAGKDKKFACTPDFVFNNLNDAVSFIVGPKNNYVDISQKIYEQYQACKKNNLIVAVGGCARSGKSTFVKFLENYIKEHKVDTMILGLDNWLIGADQRAASTKVIERYQVDKIKIELEKLHSGKEILISRYDPQTRTVIKDVDVVTPLREGIIIIEGVLGLLEDVSRIADIKIYVEVSDEIRRQRLFDFYAWKGFDRQKAEKTICERELEEVPFVKSFKKGVVWVVSMGDSS